MKTVIFNGSPRRKKSNSDLLINCFIKGFGEPIPVYYLADTHKIENNIEFFKNAETILIVFPLYTDSMPGIVKLFFEALYDKKVQMSGKKVGFIVQSGFPESLQSTFLEKYLIKFSKKMNFNYLGTVIKGGVEGVQMMPPSYTKKLFTKFEKLGKIFAETNMFDEKLTNELRKPFKLSKFRIFMLKALNLTGITNFYWNYNLKKNKAYEKRFDKPYLI